MDEKFDILLADPPWYYNPRNHSAKFGNGANKYNLMRTHDICNLNIQSVSSKDALLFMWATWPRLEDALAVIRAWDFVYKTIGFIWVKKNRNGEPFAGPGNYTASNSEPCLLATKGKPLLPEIKLVPSVVWHPKMEHSRKPDDIHLRIDKMYPNKSKVELFARRQYNGWTCLGLDLGFDLREL